MATLLISGRCVLIDDQDFMRVTRHKWCVGKATAKKSYAQANSPGGRKGTKQFRMHRFILELHPGDGLVVDHKNGNTLDNRRKNLRITTTAKNNVNKDLSCGGAYRTKSGWVSKIGVNGIRKYLGHFKTEEDARNAYRIAAREIYGEFTRV